MPKHIKQLKQDKIIQDACLTEFNTLNKDKQCPNWSEAIATYNINEVVYSVLLQLCDMWIKSKLQVGLKKMDFPIEARQYVEWIVNLSKERTTLSMDVSWCIYAVNLPFDKSYYLKRHLNNPISIGLCVLDNIEDLGRDVQWSVDKFCNLLNGMMVVLGGSMPSQYVMLSFLNTTNFFNLQIALKSLGGMAKEQFNGALHF